jgi:HEAT repeat protein
MVTNTTKNNIDIVELKKKAQKFELVKGVIGLLFMAAKNHTMYPEDHAINQESLQAVVSRLNFFLNKYGDLRLDIEKDRLLYEDETVYQDDPNRDKLAYPLFRDGIQWMEFQAGIEIWELSDFIKILNQYRILQEEPKGDLVTALWEMDLPHVQYSATDVLWRGETVTDFSAFSLTGDGKQCAGGSDVENTGDQGITDDEQRDAADTIGGKGLGGDMALSIMDRTIWEMTPEELQRLKEMVAEEEAQTSLEDVFDVLWLILSTQNELEDYGVILEFMKEEFKSTLAQAEFQIALDFLAGLKKNYQSSKTEKPWALPLLRQFFVDIAKPQILGALKEVLPSLDKQHADQVDVLRKLLLSLPPVSITTLAPLLMEKLSASLEQQLMEIIGSMARKDTKPLEQLLDRPEEDLVKKLVYILGHLDGEKPTQILIRMTHHSSGRVRLEALKALEHRNKNMIKELFHLINDPILTIRLMMWNHLEQFKNEETGDLILDYLKQQKIFYRDDRQILNCFKTLGWCNTLSSIPFLGQTLLDKGLDFGSERSLQRQGAALALLELNTQEAQDILKKASRSLFPNVRSAYQKALKDYQ